MRRRRVLLVLGPLAGTVGAWAGIGLGWNGAAGIAEVSREVCGGDGLGFLAVASFLATLLTWAACAIGMKRPRFFHAGKASAVIALLLFVPFAYLGFLAAGWAGC
jgi:hypothetical protein